MTVTVCITTYKRPELLKVCISSVFDNRVRPIEIVVSDNYFSDESRQAVDSLKCPAGITIRHLPNPGSNLPSANVMNAFAEASNERVILLNDDDFMVPGGIDLLVEAWDAHDGEVDAVYGRQYIARDDGDIDMELTDGIQKYCQRDRDFGIQPSSICSALQQQVPNNGMMLRRSLALATGYPSEAEVGRGPIDVLFAIRYAMNGTRPFLLIPGYTSACRFTSQSLSRSARVFDGHLTYEALEALSLATPGERRALARALARFSSSATAGYISAGRRWQASRIYLRHVLRMEKPISARLLLGALLLGELAGLRIMKRHSVEVSRSYNALFKNSDGTFRRYRLWSR